MTIVVKKGGKKQAFKPSKILKSIGYACKDAKVSGKKKKAILNVIKPVIAALRKKKRVRTSEIRKTVLAKIGKVSKKVVAAWRRYDKKKAKKKK